VLVVEDNEINQQVAQELLQGFGLAVEIASNGRRAVEALAKPGNHFDVVLMDLQMPEMDGYEATQVIRLGLSKDDLPIVAMTAHALQSELRKCLEAGMNDYVCKPVVGKTEGRVGELDKTSSGARSGTGRRPGSQRGQHSARARN
jgi:CheY-like chemotaxis protein